MDRLSFAVPLLLVVLAAGGCQSTPNRPAAPPEPTPPPAVSVTSRPAPEPVEPAPAAAPRPTMKGPAAIDMSDRPDLQQSSVVRIDLIR